MAAAPGSSLKSGAPPQRQSRWVNRAAFYAHLWIGVIFTFALLSISITGNPGRDPADHRLRMQYLRRPADGFEWGRNPGETFN